MTKRVAKAGGLKRLGFTPKENPNPERWNKACKPVDALAPERIADHMPSSVEMYKDAEYASQICHDGARAGAGGVKVGLPGLRPNGQKAYDDFHNRFTREKEKKEEKKPVSLREFTGKGYQGPKFKVVAIPETFCVLCCRRDVDPATAAINVSPIAEPWDGFGIIPGDCMRYAFCQPCFAKMKSEKGGGIEVMTAEGPLPLSLLRAIERAKIIDANVEKFLRAAKLAGTPGVFPKED